MDEPRGFDLGGWTATVFAACCLLGFYAMLVLMTIIMDVIPYTLRTMLALAGTSRSHFTLICALARARHQLMNSFPEIDEPLDCWSSSPCEAEAFSAALYACHQAHVALWRIRLVAGPLDRWYTPTPLPA